MLIIRLVPFKYQLSYFLFAFTYTQHIFCFEKITTSECKLAAIFPLYFFYFTSLNNFQIDAGAEQ